ncbi:hypothetical protein B0A49_08632 [Cryomyces minteri]|uniref:Uncharacterized protein n=1 Tax=Cryomyces minteri TaxID=331657 RepID=A0A4U0WVA7_9PEZI|nr:hypothetical protein B0A49_08632 [Cryomyces minteri]
MPRDTGLPTGPSGEEFDISLHRSFSGPPSKKVEIIGSANRQATIKHTEHTGKNILTSEGTVKRDEVDELLGACAQLRGLPTNSNKDLYGFDVRVSLTTFDIQWDNGDDIEGAESDANPTEENKQMFKEVVDRIEALARKHAKQ